MDSFTGWPAEVSCVLVSTSQAALKNAAGLGAWRRSGPRRNRSKNPNESCLDYMKNGLNEAFFGAIGATIARLIAMNNATAASIFDSGRALSGIV